MVTILIKGNLQVDNMSNVLNRAFEGDGISISAACVGDMKADITLVGDIHVSQLLIETDCDIYVTGEVTWWS